MKIALIGYGKMGKEIERIARSRGHEIVCIIDIDNQEDFQSEAFRSADVAIEFTTPTAAYGNYMKAFEAGVKLVSGSTGWTEEHGEEVRRLCTEGGRTLFWSSNFSLGELRDRWGGMPGMRIASRLGGACERIQMGGVDRRLS